MSWKPGATVYHGNTPMTVISTHRSVATNESCVEDNTGVRWTLDDSNLSLEPRDGFKALPPLLSADDEGVTEVVDVPGPPDESEGVGEIYVAPAKKKKRRRFRKEK